MKKLLLAIAVCSTLLFACESVAKNDPKTALNSFLEALSKNDFVTASKYATEDSKFIMNIMENGMKMSRTSAKDNKFISLNMEIGEPKIDGAKAWVPVKEKTSGESINFPMKKEKNEWKVALDIATIMSMANEKMKEKGINPDDSLSKAFQEYRNMDSDSLRVELNEVLKTRNKLKQ